MPITINYIPVDARQKNPDLNKNAQQFEAALAALNAEESRCTNRKGTLTPSSRLFKLGKELTTAEEALEKHGYVVSYQTHSLDPLNTLATTNHPLRGNYTPQDQIVTRALVLPKASLPASVSLACTALTASATSKEPDLNSTNPDATPTLGSAQF